MPPDLPADSGTKSLHREQIRHTVWGSARETFDCAELCRVEIPLPSIETQRLREIPGGTTKHKENFKENAG